MILDQFDWMHFKRHIPLISVLLAFSAVFVLGTGGAFASPQQTQPGGGPATKAEGKREAEVWWEKDGEGFEWERCRESGFWDPSDEGATGCPDCGGSDTEFSAEWALEELREDKGTPNPNQGDGRLERFRELMTGHDND